MCLPVSKVDPAWAVDVPQTRATAAVPIQTRRRTEIGVRYLGEVIARGISLGESVVAIRAACPTAVPPEFVSPFSDRLSVEFAAARQNQQRIRKTRKGLPWTP